MLVVTVKEHEKVLVGDEVKIIAMLRQDLWLDLTPILT